MTPERWQQVKDIFERAVECGPTTRAAYIRERCGDDEELRKEVESLLASDPETGSLLDNPLMETGLMEMGDGASASSALLPAQNDSFGPYVPVRVLGEGGMGTVYLARQLKPIRREVELKVVKLGMDTRQVLERFEIERQALALMDYPNVARVLDAGTSQLGRPYFVMEYVDGVPITQYCDAKALSTHQRLHLFIPVCNALQHAHKKGIIHRDVKPSNVLVTEVDGKPVPKVIDFGIARATEQRSVEHNAFTLDGQIVGTPEYMSPEQANLGSSDIDTGTDVYSLGVVLYELLVGALPLDVKSMRKPTARITQMGAAAEGLALQRSTSPGQLKRELAGDLDSIVMKAIDKDRHYRYGSASEFAADIERYLKNEPVLAGPPGAAYRTRKFVVRHKLPVAAAVAVAVALIGGIFATTWEARVAGQERAAAISEKANAQRQSRLAEEKAREADAQRVEADAQRAQAEKHRREAEGQSARADAQTAAARLERSRAEEKAREATEQRMEADAQRREAEELFGNVRDLTNSMLFDVAEQISELQGATAARETLVRKGLEYLNRLSKNPRATPELRRELAEAYMKIGDLQGRALRPNLGDQTSALESYKLSVALLENIAKESPTDSKVAHQLIQAYLRRGRLETKADSDADYARAVAMAEARVTAEPKSQETRHDLASSLASLTASASGFEMSSRPTRYEKNVLRARALFEELLNEGAKDPEIRRELAWQYRNLSRLDARRNPGRSLELLLTAVKQMASLSQDFPSNGVYRREHANALINAAGALQAAHRTKEAIDYNKLAVALMHQVMEKDARNISYRRDLVQFQISLASLLDDSGSRQPAMEVFKQALADADQMVAEQPDNPEFRYQRASLNEQIGSKTGAADLKMALDHWGRAAAELEELMRKYPDQSKYGTLLARLRLDVGKSGGDDSTAGWYKDGSKPQEYDFSVDPTTPYGGKASHRIQSKPGVKTTGFGTMDMGFSPALYICKRVRLSTYIKSEGVKEWGGLWMRVDDHRHLASGSPSVLAFDNMHDGKDRAIRGTTEWQNASVVLDVPDGATGIFVGYLLSGPGTLWVSEIKVEVVGPDVPATGGPLLEEPALATVLNSGSGKYDMALLKPDDSKLEDYDFGVDAATTYNRQPSTYIRSKEGLKDGGSGSLGGSRVCDGMQQCFIASSYIGKRIRLSGALKSEGVTQRGGLYMEMWTNADERLAFDDMIDRSIKGTTEWQTYSVVLDVPEGTEYVCTGFLLDGRGTLWANGMTLEAVGSDVPVTGRPVKQPAQ